MFASTASTGLNHDGLLPSHVFSLSENHRITITVATSQIIIIKITFKRSILTIKHYDDWKIRRRTFDLHLLEGVTGSGVAHVFTLPFL